MRGQDGDVFRRYISSRFEVFRDAARHPFGNRDRVDRDQHRVANRQSLGAEALTDFESGLGSAGIAAEADGLSGRDVHFRDTDGYRSSF